MMTSHTQLNQQAKPLNLSQGNDPHVQGLSHKRGYVLRLCEDHAELWMTEEETRYLIATYHDYKAQEGGPAPGSSWRERFRFYHRIEKEMRKILQVGDLPLVVTGRRMDLYIYRRINTYPWLLELVESQPGQSATKYLDRVQKKIQWILSHLENFITIGNASPRRARSSVG